MTTGLVRENRIEITGEPSYAIDVCLSSPNGDHNHAGLVATAMRVVNAIWYLPGGAQWRDTVGRMLDLVIDGLRYGVPARAQPRSR